MNGEVTTDGTFRVLGQPRSDDELLCIDVSNLEAVMADAEAGVPVEARDAFDPTYVPTTGYEGATARAVAALEPGNVVEATLTWVDGTPRFESLAVRERTLLHFCRGLTGAFEAARETWRSAREEDAAMAARPTRSTDGEVIGGLYVFAKASGARDVFEEFVDGVLPLDPLVRKASDAADDDGPREVFVLEFADEPFVVVLIALRRGGVLASTVRETYDCDWAGPLGPETDDGAVEGTDDGAAGEDGAGGPAGDDDPTGTERTDADADPHADGDGPDSTWDGDGDGPDVDPWG
jgi:hypothetical protein